MEIINISIREIELEETKELKSELEIKQLYFLPYCDSVSSGLLHFIQILINMLQVETDF